MPTAEMELQQQHQHTTLDVPTVTCSPPQVGGEDSSELAGEAPQAAAGDGGPEHSVGTKDLQNIRLLVDIGDGRTIEIPLKGYLVLQQQNGSSAPQAAPAVAGGNAADDGEKYLDKMRGWLMTVGTLFISIAFQAAMQPPSWIPDNQSEVLHGKSASSGTPPTMFAPSPSLTAATAVATMQPLKAYIYMMCNMITFATSLALVLLLLVMKEPLSAKYTIYMVKFLVLLVCMAVGCTFVAAYSNNGPPISAGSTIFGVFVSLVFLCVVGMPCLVRLAARFLLSCGCHAFRRFEGWPRVSYV